MERLKSDRDAARKARSDTLAINLLVTLYAEAARVGKDGGDRDTTDQEAIASVRKFIKNATDTLGTLKAAGRPHEDAEREIEILSGYLPAGVAEADVEKVARQAFAEAIERAEQRGKPLAKPAAAKGDIVKALKEAFGDSFDGSVMMPVVDRVVAG
jgi:uncharacterized protein YqeY